MNDEILERGGTRATTMSRRSQDPYFFASRKRLSRPRRTGLERLPSYLVTEVKGHGDFQVRVTPKCASLGKEDRAFVGTRAQT